MSFPEHFLWGVATSAYQIEGAVREDGRGESIWDAFIRQPGAVKDGDTGDVACDHYHRYAEDAALMGELGARAYRFSISWPRVLPRGIGAINDKGLAFYDRLVDALLERGVQPWATLFHWDYPRELQHHGGWLNPQSPEWFAEYTGVVVDRLSDRVSHWMTINEPQVFLGAGWLMGAHPPGFRLDRAEVLRAIHHTLLSHGRAVQVIRERAKTRPTIGWAPVCDTHYPATHQPEDVEAARARTFATADVTEWTYTNALYSDPICLGAYPEDAHELFGADMPATPDDQMRTISEPIDFFGVNIYFGTPHRAGDPHVFWADKRRPGGGPRTTMDWPITPEALRWGPRFTHERYGVPIYITENGMACHDWPLLDGRIHDPNRVDYLARYLAQLRLAIADGADVRGYFAWSFMDNFEWNEGYRRRFGLVHVDYDTLERTPKDSFRWYAEAIATNGASIPAP